MEICRKYKNPRDFDEIITYGKDFLNYEIFLSKDICFQHNLVQIFEKKY